MDTRGKGNGNRVMNCHCEKCCVVHTEIATGLLEQRLLKRKVKGCVRGGIEKMIVRNKYIYFFLIWVRLFTGCTIHLYNVWNSEETNEVWNFELEVFGWNTVNSDLYMACSFCYRGPGI